MQFHERRTPLLGNVDDRQGGQNPFRRVYFAACAITLLLAAHISFVPFDFRLPDRPTLVQAYGAAMEPGIYSRANFVANIVMFVPIGFFGAGLLGVHRRPFPAALAAMIAVAGMALLASIVLEGVQVLLPRRTAAITDVVAQVIGTLTGITLFRSIGSTTTAWLRRARTRAADDPALPLLQVVSAIFVVTSLAPLDVTLSGSTLARKFRDGGIRLLPFSEAAGSDMLPAIISDLAMAAPIGALALLMVSTESKSRRVATAWVAGMFVISAVELCQVVVRSRVADVTDVLVGSIGIACGIAAARLLSSFPAMTTRTRWLAARAGLGIALSLYAIANWSPFDFMLSDARVTERWRELLQVPFYTYYVNSELQALTTFVAKAAIVLPIAVFAAAARRELRRGVFAVATALGLFFLAVEIGQIFVPSRFPDISDVILGGSVVAGALVADRRARENR